MSIRGAIFLFFPLNRDYAELEETDFVLLELGLSVRVEHFDHNTGLVKVADGRENDLESGVSAFYHRHRGFFEAVW